MGLAAADESDLCHPGDLQIGHVPAPTRERAVVLAPAHRTPDVTGALANVGMSLEGHQMDDIAGKEDKRGARRAKGRTSSALSSCSASDSNSVSPPCRPTS